MNLFKILVIALSAFFSFNAMATVQKFTIDGITYEYSFDNNGDNESLSVVGWDASIINLVIPEGIEVPDDTEAQEISAIKTKGRKFKLITLFRPLAGVIVPATESITFKGASIQILFAFSSLPNLRSVSLSPNAEIIPSNFLKGCKNIKSYVIGSKVREIGAHAFAGTGLEKIFIPASVERIDEYAFTDCENLTEVVIESYENQNCYSNFIVNRHQFQNCRSLESITIGAGVKRINPREVFNGCNVVKEFTISSGLDELYFEGYYNGRCIFEDCSLRKIIINRNYDSDFKAPFDPYKPSPFSDHPTLEEVEVGGTATRLNMDAFKSCPKLYKVEFHVPLEEIDNGAFRDLPSLKKINLPDGIEVLSGHIFEDCENLVEISMPASIKKIAEYAFKNCKSLPNLTLHEGVESLDVASFQGCTSFTEFTFPNSLKEPGSHTFSNCENLCKVIIGTSLDHVDPGLFSGCPLLYDFIFVDGEEYWDSWYRVDNYGSCSAYPVKNLYLGRNHNYVTHYFAEQPFSGSSTLLNVTLGDKLTEIQPWAFHLCKNITNITFGVNIETIGEGAFFGNESLTSIVLPASLKDIGSRVFDECNALTEITSLNPVPPSVQGKAALGWKSYDNAIVYVPEGSVDAYKDTFPWSEFKCIREIGNSGVEDIISDSPSGVINYTLPYEVYTLSGAKAGNSINSLTSGIYIVRQGNTVTKISIN